MTILTVEPYKDHAGRDQNRITHECDGPACPNRTTFDPERGGDQPIIQEWWRIDGPDDGGVFCSKPCLVSWAVS